MCTDPARVLRGAAGARADTVIRNALAALGLIALSVLLLPLAIPMALWFWMRGEPDPYRPRRGGYWDHP